MDPVCGSWDRVEDIKDDECERSRYEGDNLTDQTVIFYFVGGDASVDGLTDYIVIIKLQRIPWGPRILCKYKLQQRTITLLVESL
jgi:hypothetical protein